MRGARRSGFSVTVYAQAPAIKRSVLQKTDVPDGKKYEVVFGMAELPAGVAIGKHTHPGIEQGTVVSGELVLMVEGQPEKAYKAGDSWQIPGGRRARRQGRCRRRQGDRDLHRGEGPAAGHSRRSKAVIPVLVTGIQRAATPGI